MLKLSIWINDLHIFMDGLDIIYISLYKLGFFVFSTLIISRIIAYYLVTDKPEAI